MTRARNIAGFSTITTTPSPVHVGPIGVLTATRIDGEFNQVDLATRNITAAGIAATNLQVSGITTGLNVSGIITAQNGINFNGTSTGLNASGVGTIATLNVSGNATISGNANIGGVLTYEDVTNVDSVGVVTARTDINLGDSIIHIGDTNTKIRFPAADTVSLETAGSEVLRCNSSGQVIIDDGNTEGGSNTRLAVVATGSAGSNPSSITNNVVATFRATGATGHAASIAVLSGNTGSTALHFGDTDNDVIGRILYNHTSSNASDYMMFQVAGTEYMRLTHQGHLGVGDLTNVSGVPQTGLHYADSSAIFRIQNTTNDYYSHISVDANGNLTLDADAGNGSGSSTISLKTDGSEKVRIDSSGRLLIGHTSVGAKSAAAPLQIQTASSGAFALNIRNRSANDYGFITFTDDDASEDLVQIGIQRTAANTADLFFYTNGGNASSNERLRIDSSGNITAVNTASGGQSVTLKVGASNASGANAGKIVINNGGTGDAQLQFDYESSTARAKIYVYRSEQELRFDTAGSEKLRISSAGQVRINTAGAPSADLHVGGTDAVLNALFQTSRSSGAYHKYALGQSGADLGYIGSAQQISASGQADGFAIRSENHIEFCAGGSTERIRIDDNGNLVIGHSAANAKLQINSGTSNAVGDETNPAIQIGGTGNYRLAMLTTSEAGIIYNKNGDDGIRLQTKSGNSTPIRFIVYPEQINGQDNYANTNTGALNTSQAHPTGVFEYRSRTDQGVEKYNSYIQCGAGSDSDIYITIRNSGFYRITVKASNSSVSADVAMYLVYGLNSQVTGNRITEVVSSGSFTVTTINSRLNSYDSTIKISYSGSMNQGIRALVETIGGF